MITGGLPDNQELIMQRSLTKVRLRAKSCQYAKANIKAICTSADSAWADCTKQIWF